MDVQFLVLVVIFIIFLTGYVISGNTDPENKIIPDSVVFNKDIYFQEFYTYIDDSMHKFDTMGLTNSTSLTSKDWFFRITMGTNDNSSEQNAVYDLIVIPDQNVRDSSVLLKKYYYTAESITSCYVYDKPAGTWTKTNFNSDSVNFWKIKSLSFIEDIKV